MFHCVYALAQTLFRMININVKRAFLGFIYPDFIGNSFNLLLNFFSNNSNNFITIVNVLSTVESQAIKESSNKRWQ